MNFSDKTFQSFLVITFFAMPQTIFCMQQIRTKLAQPMVFAATHNAIRHSTSQSENPTDSAKKDEDVNADQRMHRSDMNELKHYIDERRISYWWIYGIGIVTGMITSPHEQRGYRAPCALGQNIEGQIKALDQKVSDIKTELSNKSEIK